VTFPSAHGQVEDHGSVGILGEPDADGPGKLGVHQLHLVTEVRELGAGHIHPAILREMPRASEVTGHPADI
jgi:hypothetical protein